ncbi:CynX/NimT family MFS transporter [Rhodothermus marinus]|uniref:CynX/NimT family MFS transporter n=1 Tax=Rhodothermus marinus TaxID=29549 RepID=UPI0006D1D7D1
MRSVESDVQIQHGWIVAGVLAAAANLRAPLTAVGPLIPHLQRDLSLSHTAVGLLTTLPLLAFGLGSFGASRLAARFGMARVLLLSMILLTIGELVRPFPAPFYLFIGTLLVGVAIAVDNVLLPAVVKESFPARLGVLTGLYLATMHLMASLASGLSVPMAETWGLGWEGALRCWALLAFVAALLWIPPARRSSPTTSPEPTRRSLPWRSALAWQVTLFMGLQSFFFYCMITWIPALAQDRGLSATTAGWILFAFLLAQLPLLFITPVLAERRPHQQSLALAAGLLTIAGVVGFMIGKGVMLWSAAILAGAGAGMGFSLAMTLFPLRTRTPLRAADLSAMAQAVGYLLAAVGPTTFGFLYDQTHQFTASLGMLLGVTLLMLGFGVAASRPRFVD